MRSSLSELPLILLQLVLMASAELVEAFEPRPAGVAWAHAWHRRALRLSARHRIA